MRKIGAKVVLCGVGCWWILCLVGALASLTGCSVQAPRGTAQDISGALVLPGLGKSEPVKYLLRAVVGAQVVQTSEK